FLEGESYLRRVIAAGQARQRHLGRRLVNEAKRFQQRHESVLLAELVRQQIRQGGGVFQQCEHLRQQCAQPVLLQALGGGIHRGQAILQGQRRAALQHLILRVVQLQAAAAIAHFTV